MRSLKTLFNRLLSRLGLQSTPSSNQYQRLEMLRDQHQTINLRVVHSNNNYQTLVLRIDLDNKELVIDNLFPPLSQEILNTGDTVELISQAPDCLLNLYTRVICHEQEGKESYYRLELPMDMGKNHNRKSYRVYVDGERNLSINLGIDEKELNNVRINNLAVDGIKLYFVNNIQDKLSIGRFFDQTVITLPDGYNIDCQLQIRNRYLFRATRPHSIAGGTLLISNAQQQKKLELYLASVQRKQRRRENRVT